MITLAISDVMGSDPATIGSGPTVLDTPDSTVDRCRRILEKYKLLDCLSAEGRDILISPDHDLETPKSIPDGERFEYHIILSNELLLKRMKKELAAQYPSLTVPGVAALSAAGKESISVEQMGEELLRVGRKFISEKKVSGNDGPGDCLLYITGGEPTVRVEGKGTGGRTQHVALLFLQGLLCDPALAGRMGDITLVAFATDGKDGNSPAAGCIVDRELFDVFLGRSGRDNGATNHRMSEEVERHIREFDSHSFFEKYDSLITTGPTGTNVMDIYIVSIKATKS